jgi:hypothetical protein
MTALMFDLESLNMRASSVITSIGAVKFEPRGDWLGDEFHMHVSIANSLHHGRSIGADTLLWWLAQENDARRTLVNGQHEAAPLIVALDAFAGFYEGCTEIWCNGASFDFSILADAYAGMGIERPWDFWKERDLRTLKGLFPTDFERLGVRHNALDDARHQARLVQHILRFNPDLDS